MQGHDFASLGSSRRDGGPRHLHRPARRPWLHARSEAGAGKKLIGVTVWKRWLPPLPRKLHWSAPPPFTTPRRDEAYLSLMENGMTTPPSVLPFADAIEAIRAFGPCALAGTGAPAAKEKLDEEFSLSSIRQPDALFVARLTATRPRPPPRPRRFICARPTPTARRTRTGDGVRRRRRPILPCFMPRFSRGPGMSQRSRIFWPAPASSLSSRRQASCWRAPLRTKRKSSLWQSSRQRGAAAGARADAGRRRPRRTLGAETCSWKSARTIRRRWRFILVWVLPASAPARVIMRAGRRATPWCSRPSFRSRPI